MAVSLTPWPSDGFDQFWSLYPNRIGKLDARKAFDKVQKSNTVTWPDLMAALDRYVHKDDFRHWCHPGTWLRQGRWMDEPAKDNGRGNGKDNGVWGVDRW